MENLNLTTEVVERETTENPNTENVTMGEQTKPNQDADSQPNHDNGKPVDEEKKVTRTPYDGSTPHSVVPAKLENVEQATKAKKRLILRLAFLNSEYAKCVDTIQHPNKSISEKAPAVKTAEKINDDLKKLQVVANELRDRVPKLEELVNNSILFFDPTTKVEVTI